MENEETITTPEVVTGQETATNEEPKVTEKTYSQADVDKLLKGRFTQEQVNEIVEKRLSRAKTQAPVSNSAESEELARVKSDLSSMQLKLAEYEKQVALGKYKINEQYKDYVDFKVVHNTDKNKSYEQALEEFFADEENKRYLEGAERPSMPRPRNTNSSENSNAQSNELRAMFGLGKK